MTTTIGSCELDRDLILENEYEYSLVNASVEPSIGGGIVIQEFEKLEKGRPVTLVSTETQGLQLKSTVDDLKALADVSGATYTLTISSNSQTFTKTVRFRNEIAGGPIEAQPFHPRDGLHGDSILFRIKLYLMVI